MPKASSSRSLPARAARTRSSGHYFHARCLVRQWIHSLRQSWWLWSDPLLPAVARSVLGFTEECKDYGILGDDALFLYFCNAWYDRGDMYCVSTVRSRRLVLDNGGMAGSAGYDAPRLCSSWFAQAKICSILAGMVQMDSSSDMYKAGYAGCECTSRCFLSSAMMLGVMAGMVQNGSYSGMLQGWFFW